MDFLGGLIQAGASLFGQNQTNQVQQQMMMQQQQFQQGMSSTAYQRASADMTAAGLNPMMMFGSGSAASTPAGASPPPSVKSGLGDAVAAGISTATQQKVAAATIDNLVAENAKIKADTLTSGATQLARLASAANIDADTDNKRVQKDILGSTGIITRNSAKTAANQLEMNADARRILDMGSFAGKGLSEIVSPIGDLAWSAKGVRSLFPKRTRVEGSSQETFGKGFRNRDNFTERYEGW